MGGVGGGSVFICVGIVTAQQSNTSQPRLAQRPGGKNTSASAVRPKASVLSPLGTCKGMCVEQQCIHQGAVLSSGSNRDGPGDSGGLCCYKTLHTFSLMILVLLFCFFLFFLKLLKCKKTVQLLHKHNFRRGK